MSLPSSDPSVRGRLGVATRRGSLAGLLVVAATVSALPLPSVGATAPPPGTAPTGVVSWHRGADGLTAGSHRITLLTGDVVALQVAPDGRQAAWIADPVDEQAEPHVFEVDGEVHVVPAEAIPYVASGVLDDDLFNVTLLARDGYDDRASEELPLLIEAAPTRTASVPDAPDGTDEVRELDSVDIVSVAADKADIRTAWEAIRGPDAARMDSTDARLADGATVWLNGKVEASLDDSVAQIGAPQAWARGYDGDGTTVAVLDTGYDADHPDLAGRVVGAQNFTDVPDPDGAVAADGNGHGTHVAATVGGSGAASDGDRQGVAPGADLLVGKVLDNAGEGSTDQIIAGMEWAVEQGADVVNLSLGTISASDGTDPLSQAVNDLTRSSDTLFVVAAGNTGPRDGSVGSPGAADLALTVGAVTKQDTPAAFSSRGPRIGDGAIKPELTAPGVDIVAARAAGTSLGNLLDQYYTALNGTSMATPHVAGAAAILAERHPDWDAAALKAGLVSTAETQPDQPVRFQGGGRLDVAAAVRDAVTVDEATLSLGQVGVDADPISRELTYRNASDRPRLLRLWADVAGTGSDTDREPAIRLSRSFVWVPARGSASVTVTLRPRSTESGGYAGQIVARPLTGGPADRLHTTMSFDVEGPMRTLTIEALDRNGQPATGPVDLWSAETGTLKRVFLRTGTTSVQVPDGLYSVVASIEAGSSGESTIAASPELRIDADRTLRFDAREGRPIAVDAPRPADLNRVLIHWNRSVGGRTVSSIVASGYENERVYALRSPTVRKGDFTLASQWQLQQPLLTVATSGRSEPLASTSQQASTQVYDGPTTLPLVDAGDGTPEAFAQVDVDGAVALVSRRSGAGNLAAQAEAAAAAGAELLLAANPTPDRWLESVDAAIPVYRLDAAGGQALRTALGSRADLTVDVRGIADSTYLYELTFTEDRRVPDGKLYRVHPGELAAVTSDYHQNSDRQRRAESWIPYIDDVGVGNAMAIIRAGPLVRTDYVSTEGVDWQRMGAPHEFLNTYWTSDAPMSYRAGREYRQQWWGPLIHPAVPTVAGGAASAPVLGGGYTPVIRYRDAIRVNLPHYSYGGSLAGTIWELYGDRSTLTLERDGKPIGTSTWPRVQYTVPADRGWYDLTLDVTNGSGNWSDTSAHTQTAWHFRSARSDESGTPVPLVQVGYRLDTDAYNQVPSDAAYSLYLDPGYQPEASGPGRFTAEVEVSFDDGATWQATSVTRTGDRLRAQIPAAAGPGYASLRTTVTDAAGNQLTQQIDRAWKIAAP